MFIFSMVWVLIHSSTWKIFILRKVLLLPWFSLNLQERDPRVYQNRAESSTADVVRKWPVKLLEGSFQLLDISNYMSADIVNFDQNFRKNWSIKSIFLSANNRFRLLQNELESEPSNKSNWWSDYYLTAIFDGRWSRTYAPILFCW